MGAWEEHIEECAGQCQHCHCNHEDGKCSCTRNFVWEETPEGRVKRFFSGACESYEPEEGMHEHCGPGEDDDAGEE